MLEHLINEWHQHFGALPPEVIIRAPGRVNIIGEHTDYNEGWVLPGAMSRSLYIFMSRNENHFQQWRAIDLHETFESDKSSPVSQHASSWVKYVDAALHVYNRESESFKILIGGDLPVGAGISSSSALVCGVLYALQQINGGSESKEELAKLASRVEREIMGLQGGIMDQYAIMLSHAHHVMMLDCRSRDYTYSTADLPGCKWLLINTKVKHELIDSDYNNRADECRQSVFLIKKVFPEVTSLRDVTLEMLGNVDLPDVLRKRSEFVLRENQRVHDMVLALKNNDATKAGQLLEASHAGLRNKYEVSCEELDHLAHFANTHPNVYGARMMGGGFGGCVICLVKEEEMEIFLASCVVSYTERFGFEPAVIHFSLSSGVEQLS